MSSTLNPGGRAGPIVARAKAIILTPATEWRVIDMEVETPASLYRNYIMILAAIGPICSFLHGVLFGYGAFGFSYHPSVVSALVSAAVSYAITLAMVFVMALIIDALAPTFQGQKSQIQALKLVAYASTASWLAGIFHLLPGTGLLAILGLYSAYLFWTGLPVMMKSPPEKTLPYTLVIIVVAVVLAVVIAPITAILVGGTGARHAGTYYGSGTITTPEGGNLSLDRIQQAAKAITDSTQSAANGTPASVVSAEALKAMLPASLAGGLARQDASSGGGQVAGFGGSAAEAVYRGNGAEITMNVADLGVIGALAGATGALGITGNHEDSTSYSKLSQEDGRTIAEEYDRSEKHGSYGVIVGNRFMVHAEGSNVPMAALRDAVAQVDLDRLQALAKPPSSD
ncbi:MAG TPA: Yip1 family protein [Acetobacteraceae bacterium]|nr:Yip1 family protein [Acetobacteraceae bacterium]